MAAIVLVAAAGVFVLGAVAGIVAVVSYGIHREQKRLRGEQGIRAGPDAPDYFLAEQAPDVVSEAARRLNGLYVHHLPLAILGGHGFWPGRISGLGSGPGRRSARPAHRVLGPPAESQFGRASNGQPDDMWRRHNGSARVVPGQCPLRSVRGGAAASLCSGRRRLAASFSTAGSSRGATKCRFLVPA